MHHHRSLFWRSWEAINQAAGCSNRIGLREAVLKEANHHLVWHKLTAF
jgi:hypothetical protein